MWFPVLSVLERDELLIPHCPWPSANPCTRVDDEFREGLGDVYSFFGHFSLVQLAQIASVSAVSNMGESVECQP